MQRQQPRREKPEQGGASAAWVAPRLAAAGAARDADGKGRERAAAGMHIEAHNGCGSTELARPAPYCLAAPRPSL